MLADIWPPPPKRAKPGRIAKPADLAHVPQSVIQTFIIVNCLNHHPVCQCRCDCGPVLLTMPMDQKLETRSGPHRWRFRPRHQSLGHQVKARSHRSECNATHILEYHSSALSEQRPSGLYAASSTGEGADLGASRHACIVSQQAFDASEILADVIQVCLSSRIGPWRCQAAKWRCQVRPDGGQGR